MVSGLKVSWVWSFWSSLGGHWEPLGAPQGGAGRPWGAASVHAISLGVLGRVPVSGESLGVSGVVPGRPRGLLGEGPGGTENTDGFLRVSGGGPGGSLG